MTEAAMICLRRRKTRTRSERLISSDRPDYPPPRRPNHARATALGDAFGCMPN